MSEWKRYKLSELYEMSSGISSTKEQAGHGSPFLSFSVVFNNYFLPDSLIDLMDTTDGEKQKYSIKEGDIFLTRTSETVDELAMSSVALKDYPEASFSGFLKRLRPVDKTIVYPKFMAFYLRSPLFRRTIINNTVMTLRASFNEAMFSYLEIMLPDFDTQKKIGDFLYSLEKKKQINNQINQELEAMAKTLYDYWFVQFDFPDQNGKPYKSSGGKMVYNPELKREIPEGWGVEKLGDITICHDSKRVPLSSNDRELVKGEIPYYGATGIMDYVNDYIFDGDYVLMAEDGSVMTEKGTPILQRISGKNWVNNHAHVLEPIKNHSCKLLMMLLKDVSVMKIKTGSIQMKINQENMNKIVVPAIPLELLFEINQKLEVIDKQQLNLIEENKQLTQLRDWLLPMLMNGQVKVE